MKYLIKLKLITNIPCVIIPIIAICSATPGEFNNITKGCRDTICTTSTYRLKSDKIPDSVFKMKDLMHLSISGMDCDYGDDKNCWIIKEIPAEIKNLKNLKTLRLTLNAFRVIPKELAELPNLILLDLTDNAGFTNVEGLSTIQNLQYLYLYGCGLRQLPKNIGDLKNLKELGLVGN